VQEKRLRRIRVAMMAMSVLLAPVPAIAQTTAGSAVAQRVVDLLRQMTLDEKVG
jgi:hypothetical protein